MEDYLTRAEYRIYTEKIEAEDKRQNHRIDALEEAVKQINVQAVTLERLAVNMESMAASTKELATELSKQGERLDNIEKEPGDLWKKAVWIVVAFLIGAALTALMGGTV